MKKLNFHIAKVSRLLLKKHPNHTHLRGRGSAVQPGSIVSFLPSFRHGQSFLIVASSGETQWSAAVNDVLPRENIKTVLQLRNTRRKRLRLLSVNRLGVRTAQATKTRISDHRESGYQNPYAQSVSCEVQAAYCWLSLRLFRSDGLNCLYVWVLSHNLGFTFGRIIGGERRSQDHSEVFSILPTTTTKTTNPCEISYQLYRPHVSRCGFLSRLQG